MRNDRYTFSPCSAAKFRGGISPRNSALTFIFHTISPRNFTISRYQISRLLKRLIWVFSHNTTVYPCKPQFFYIKVGFKGVYIAWTCFPHFNIMLMLFTIPDNKHCLTHYITSHPCALMYALRDINTHSTFSSLCTIQILINFTLHLSQQFGF